MASWPWCAWYSAAKVHNFLCDSGGWQEERGRWLCGCGCRRRSRAAVPGELTGPPPPGAAPVCSLGASKAAGRQASAVGSRCCRSDVPQLGRPWW